MRQSTVRLIVSLSLLLALALTAHHAGAGHDAPLRSHRAASTVSGT